MPHAEAVSEAVGTHVSPWQHPAQVVGSHVQRPATHDCPVPHAVQVFPPVPHALALGVAQIPVAGSQQPAHVVGPQPHECEVGSHPWPAGQSPSTEQAQRPVKQVCPSGLLVQSTHAPPPPIPHVSAVSPGAQ